MNKLIKLFKPDKVITCKNCGARFRFPIKPGKTLNVTCPKCRATYKVSFVNPVMQLLKGKLKWSEMGRDEKRTIAVLVLTLLISVGMVLSSLKIPIRPTIKSDQLIENVN